MSEQPEISFKISSRSQQSDNSEQISEVPNFNEKTFIGKITQQIGKGDDAKHSIIWTTIRWCFIIATVISTILFIFLGFAYYNQNNNEIIELKKFILAMWSVFTPIITLSLGYAFGKDYK